MDRTIIYKKDRRVNSHDQHLGSKDGMTFTLTTHGNKTRKGQATKTCSPTPTSNALQG